MGGTPRASLSRGATAILKLLYDVTHEFSSTLELPVVLGKVLSLTVQALGAVKGSLFLLNEEGQVRQHILVRQHLPPEVRQQVVAVVMDKGLAGWVYRHGRGAIVDDATTDDRWHAFADDERVVRSVLSAPLSRRGVISGIITLEHPEPRAFSRADLQLLTAIAHQAAVAIENARLFTQMSEERDALISVLEGVQDAILVVNGPSRYLTLVNPAAAALFGVEPAAAVGRCLADLDPPAALARLFDEVEAGQTGEAEVGFPNQRHFHVSVQVIPRVGMLAALYDITHFKELDSIKSEFVATVSHDLKTPLGAILGYAWLLSDEDTLTANQRQYVGSILESVERIQALVDNLLDLARIEAGVDVERQLCHLPEIVEEVVGQYADQIVKKELELVAAVPGSLPALMVNRLRLAQVVSNLVSNAVKYSPARGRVTVEAGADGDVVLLKVSDNGPGISSADQRRLFEKFTRVGGKEARQIAGTGLGLAIVKSVVESYDGRVWVESQPGRGSTFFVELPISDQPVS